MFIFKESEHIPIVSTLLLSRKMQEREEAAHPTYSPEKYDDIEMYTQSERQLQSAKERGKIRSSTNKVR